MNRLQNTVRRSLLLAALWLGANMATPAQGADREELLRVVSESRYGFIDTKGKIVVPPTYDWASDFSEGLAAFAVGGHWTYEAQTGRRYEGGSYGAIDEKGNIAVKPTFSQLGRFSEKLARARVKGKCGFIDSTGTLVIEPTFDDAGDMLSGMARVRLGGKWGYCNREGQTAIKCTYDEAQDFEQDTARIKLGRKWGLVRRDGSLLTELKYDEIGALHEQRRAAKKDATWGYLSDAGAEVVRCQYSHAGRFSEGLAAVQVGGKSGYITRDGAVKIPPAFGFAGEFSEGLACVSVGEGYAFIAPDGNVVAKNTMRTPPFACGLASFDMATGGPRRWGCVDRSGKIVIPAIGAVPMAVLKCGVVRVTLREQLGSDECFYLDHSGKQVWPDLRLDRRLVEVLNVSDNPVVSSTPSGKWLGIALENGRSYLFDTGSKALTPAPASIAGSSVAIDPEGSRVAISKGTSAIVWDPVAKAEVGTISQPAWNAFWGASGREVILLTKNAIVNWDLAKSSAVARVPINGQMRAPSASLDGSVIAWVDRGDFAGIRLGAKAAPIRFSEPKREKAVWNAIVVSPDGKRLFACGAGYPTESGFLDQFEVATGAYKGSIVVPHVDKPPIAVARFTVLAISPDGRWLAFGESQGKLSKYSFDYVSHEVGVWDLNSGKECERLTGHNGKIVSLTFCGNDRLVSGSEDWTIRIWALKGAQE